ncbi:MAG TPA: ferredoxin family protein [Candidatus Thermoplasmatota archaeon]|nr:ferredoxin family protein [Candidatus Thermoplasmatota archaeon]
MTRVIVQPCIGVKSGECVDVCPVDCIHPTKDEPDFANVDMLFINPEECIDCGACEAVCPVEAIFPDDSLPAGQEEFTAKNAAYFKK